MPLSSPRPSKLKLFRSIPRYCLYASVLFAASISLYLELTLRAAARELARLELASVSGTEASAHRTTFITGNNPTPVNPPADPALQTPASKNWLPDQSSLEQQWKQAKAALGPDLVLIRGAVNQLKVRQRFHELYRLLGLSDAEITAFENAAAEKNLTFNNLVSSDPKSVDAHARGQAAVMDAIVASTLGTDYVEPFRLFLMSSDLRGMTGDLAAHSLVSGDALRPEQAAALLQTCLESRVPTADTTRIALDQIDWETVSAKSQTYLTPAQQTLLRAMIDRQNFSRTLTGITGQTLHRPIRGLNPR